MMRILTPPCDHGDPCCGRTECRLRAAIAAHLDPESGSAFWIDRARERGVTPGTVRTLDDLERLGPTTPDDLRSRPLMDFIPRKLHAQRHRLVVGQTGGATGSGTWTAYLPEEFDEAFVAPFAAAAQHVGFPQGGTWLYVGPSGPHIIGQAARAIARRTGSAEPFTVDFDPRWFRKLAGGSMAARRYTRHVVEQAMAVVTSQPVSVLFATPPVLVELAAAMSREQRRRVRGVHYGGMTVTGETLSRLQDEAFPGAVHLSGYGNTLCGCCLELSTASERALDYFPHGHRLILEITDGDGRPAAAGHVSVTRLDRSMLLVRLRERDVAQRIQPPEHAPPGFVGAGIRNPHTPVSTRTPVAGLY